jgi:hypothetical protein
MVGLALKVLALEEMRFAFTSNDLQARTAVGVIL